MLSKDGYFNLQLSKPVAFFIFLVGAIFEPLLKTNLWHVTYGRVSSAARGAQTWQHFTSEVCLPASPGGQESEAKLLLAQVPCQGLTGEPLTCVSPGFWMVSAVLALSDAGGMRYNRFGIRLHRHAVFILGVHVHTDIFLQIWPSLC